MPRFLVADTICLVISISARDGVGSPEGWLCTSTIAVADSSSARLTPKAASQDFELSRDFEPENLSQKIRFRFERVNEVTFKLTDGEFTNVPASHGKWAGFRTSRGVASVINIARGQWLARCRDQASGPSSFNEAKANALAMARGACGDYFIENPIDHLNGLQARLLDRDGEAE